jgi:hypothetical protein
MKLLTDLSPAFTEPALRIVVAYDAFEAGKRAMRTFSNLSRDHRDFRFQPQPWRFDFLADPALFEFARSDGRRADVLAIAMANGFTLPPAVRHWLTESLRERRREPGALIALFGREGELPEVDSSSLEFLRNVAHQSGFALLAPSATSATAPRFNAESCDRQWLTRRGHSAGNRHWGINE